VELAKELPDILREVAKETQQLQKAADYYSAFIKFAVQKLVNVNFFCAVRACLDRFLSADWYSIFPQLTNKK